MKLRPTLGSIVVAAVLVHGAGQLALAQVDWSFEEIAVPPGPPGAWDSFRHLVGDVVFDGTTYHMYLIGGQTLLPWDSPWAVGHWTSAGLTGPWEGDNNPVLVPGPPGTWDSYTIYAPAVLYDGGEFKMWYGATDSFPGVTLVGYATSPDGSTWTKSPDPLPTLPPGAPGEWDDGGLRPSTVLPDGMEYRMWYTAIKDGGPDWGTWRLGTATSPDGITWTKHPNPVLVGTLPWEDNFVFFPEVVPVAGGYAMWYSAVVWGEEAAIGYAMSPDGIHWGRWPGNPVLTPSCPLNAIEFLNVIIEGDTVHGWATNCYHVWHVTSPLEVVFFDAFETGDCAIWSATVP